MLFKNYIDSDRVEEGKEDRIPFEIVQNELNIEEEQKVHRYEGTKVRLYIFWGISINLVGIYKKQKSEFSK